ncbi:hypothetical protein [Microvirga mediterraneensis]|uniref:Uncharacterized protein n=1 Tax=Microvirga mediterraneensis TaxID=2754695 RepID=A0A838BPK1_9HYPH|nr:hypothetical protein [Microvirga mediterraneensis]MBA1156832.1 hypothetical protein [Microvirga mediterraneensis]
MKVTIVASTAMLLGVLLASAPAWSQHGSGPFTRSGEITIPSQRELEREVFSDPRNDFSSIDSVAEGEMDRMDRQIDGMVERGICNGC